VEEVFVRNIASNPLFKVAQVVPEIASLVGRIFFGIGKLQNVVNTYLLPLITEKRVYEVPFLWLLNRLNPIVEQRQQEPTSRVDLLKLMLQGMTDKEINVSKMNET
jgi:hypothetical protein